MKRSIKALFALLLVISILAGFAAANSSAPVAGFADGYGFPAGDSFSVNGTTALLYDLNTEMILYAQNIDDQIYPASLAKVLTCLVAIENGNLTDEVTVTSTALENIDPDGTNTDLEPGEALPLHELLYCIMLASDNEACNVVAEHIAGSVSAYVDMLNEKAAELGCTGSHFANTHGLHDDQEFTTARDLLRITRAALQNETFCEIISETSHELPATNYHDARKIYTTNYLLSTDQSYKYYDPRAKGVKTGYTGKAGRCLITTAEEGPIHLLSIVTGCTTETDEHGEYVLNNFVETKKLLEYGFSHYEFVNVLSTLMPVSEVPATGGDRGSVVVEPLQDATLTLPKGYDPEDITTSIDLYSGTPLQAPLHNGEPVGTASVYYQGTLMREVEITPISDVTEGNLVYEEHTAKEQEVTAPKKQLNVKKMLLIAALVLLGIYAVMYLSANLGKKKKKRSTARKNTAARPASTVRRTSSGTTRSSSGTTRSSSGASRTPDSRTRRPQSDTNRSAASRSRDMYDTRRR